jgi:hypothetical protein
MDGRLLRCLDFGTAFLGRGRPCGEGLDSVAKPRGAAGIASTQDGHLRPPVPELGRGRHDMVHDTKYGLPWPIKQVKTEHAAV